MHVSQYNRTETRSCNLIENPKLYDQGAAEVEVKDAPKILIDNCESDKHDQYVIDNVIIPQTRNG